RRAGVAAARPRVRVCIRVRDRRGGTRERDRRGPARRGTRLPRTDRPRLRVDGERTGDPPARRTLFRFLTPRKVITSDLRRHAAASAPLHFRNPVSLVDNYTFRVQANSMGCAARRQATARPYRLAGEDGETC